MPAGETAYHYLHDALGTVVALTDPNGVEVERYACDPYGKTVIEPIDPQTGQPLPRSAASALGNPFVWTGQRYDAGVGLYHFLFRSYSPRLGRWLQRDPAGYVDGVSLYEYVRSNPADLVDPLGLYLTPRQLWEAWLGLLLVGEGPASDAGPGGTSYSDAIRFSNEFINWPSGDPAGGQDAARHAYWQASLTYKYGEDVARTIGDIHELHDNTNDSVADQWNNSVGRGIGVLALEGDLPIGQLAELVRRALEEGKLITDRSTFGQDRWDPGTSSDEYWDQPPDPLDIVWEEIERTLPEWELGLEAAFRVWEREHWCAHLRINGGLP